MNPKRLFILGLALLSSAAAVRAQPESLASIFSNAPSGARSGQTVVPRRASILFIACHGLGLGDLSCYGQTNFQTPNIDRLAAEGTRFTDYRATGDDLATAQAALMAGNNHPFPPGGATLAARLQNVGYHTGLYGEWLLGPQPWTQGFDQFAGFLTEAEANNYYSDFIWRYAPNNIYDPTNRTLSAFVGREEIYQNTGGQRGRYLPDMLFFATTDFTRINQPDFASHYRPFFALLSVPAPASVTPDRDDYPVPTDAPFSSEPWPQAAKNRAALLTRLDNGVGRLLERLAKLGMTNNVAIFFAGEATPEKFAHTNMNFLLLPGEVRGGESAVRLRVPMIVWWPDHVPAGRVSRVPWNAADFAPTAMQIAYGKPAPSFTGTSMLPTLLGETGTNAPDVPDRQELHRGF